MAPAYFLVFFLLPHLLLPLSAAENQQSDNSKNCPAYYCGDPKDSEEHNYTGFGWLTVDNCTEPVQKIQLEMGGQLYDIASISPADTINWTELWYSEVCKCQSPENLYSSTSPSITFRTTSKQTQLKCNHSTHTLNYFGYSISSPECERSYHETPSSQCLKSHPPINLTRIDDRLFSLSAAGIIFRVRVPGPCGACYFKGDDYKGGMCYQDDNGTMHCTNEDKGSKKSRLKLALGASAAGMGVLMFIICFLMRIKFSSNKSPVLWKKETQNHQNVVAFLKDYGSLAPKRYSYSDVKKMTYSFKHKLGQGGYGGVYKGKLQNGRLVAVKVLNNSKGDGQEFVNEVASISRTSHVNIVNLLGFCFEGSKRALIYEFMPNGSLEKFIYDENPLGTNRQLGWETLYQIAIGIAQGLEYLHRGCNTQILHFDIKPHNILLDEDFCPKISDFGLAKLCPGKQSIISMLDARGTTGYIAPEVFCRSFGGVSHKSDVYSYGMMVLEMVGGRKNIDVGVDHTSQIYFPHWIHKRLEHGSELGLHGIMNEEENEKARKMILVGLWCIQTNPSNRPPMCRVLDMLQGSFGSLQIPPCPFLSSPPRSPVDSSTTPIVAS